MALMAKGIFVATIVLSVISGPRLGATYFNYLFADPITQIQANYICNASQRKEPHQGNERLRTACSVLDTRRTALERVEGAAGFEQEKARYRELIRKMEKKIVKLGKKIERRKVPR
jgi:hypothetical protein